VTLWAWGRTRAAAASDNGASIVSAIWRHDNELLNRTSLWSGSCLEGRAEAELGRA
jgi:hypothetical protein